MIPRTLTPERRSVAFQMGRFAIAGVAITLASAASYWALAELGHVEPMLSLIAVFIIFSIISYLTHGWFSFRGHGRRDRQHVRAARFLIVNLLGFGLNESFIWLLVKHLGGPTWWPTVPMVLVTPLVTFSLLRRFVYD